MAKSLAPGPEKSDKGSSEAAAANVADATLAKPAPQGSSEAAPVAEQWYEVLTRNQDGQRAVQRLRAADQAAAVAEVESGLAPGIEVVGSAPAGRNLGSSDGVNDLVDTT